MGFMIAWAVVFAVGFLMWGSGVTSFRLGTFFAGLVVMIIAAAGETATVLVVLSGGR